MSSPEFAVLIPNWNGRAVLEPCLRSVRIALRQADLAAPVLIVDDASTDDSVALLADRFPRVRVLTLKENVGFGAAVNRGMNHLDARWVFLLNNDLILRPDFFSRLLQTRADSADDALFAVGAQTLDWNDTKPSHTGMRLAFNRLLIQDPFHPSVAAPVDLFQAGACLIDREKFLALGGFCALYQPAYWEDYDLALRARRRGWTNLYEPRALAWHKGKHSMRARFGPSGVADLIRRNHLLFTWLHLDSPRLLARHFFSLPGLIAAPREALYAGDPLAWARAWIDALFRLPALLRERRRLRASSTVALSEILDQAARAGLAAAPAAPDPLLALPPHAPAQSADSPPPEPAPTPESPLQLR